MGWLSTVRGIGEALGWWEPAASPIGCSMGRTVFRETKRAAWLANVVRRPRRLDDATIARLDELFPELDLTTVRVRTRCRLPANRFQPTGSIYAMTFGTHIYWRDELDTDDPADLVRLIHELVHVDQVRRFGGESEFACEYGRGYLAGGGELPPHLADRDDAYRRNPLEAEAYRFDARFRDERGRVVPSSLPAG